MSQRTERFLAVQKYLFYFIFSLKFPSMSDQTPKPLIFIWECLSWISVFLPLHMTICIIKTVIDRFWTESMIALSEIGIEAAWFFFSFLGLLHYKNREKDLVKIVNEIEDVFKWRSPRGKTYVDMERVNKLAKYASLMWQIVPTSTILFSIVKQLFAHPMGLPVPSWYPINRNSSCQFILGFLLQSWSKMVMVSSFASGSSFYISFSILCCGQFNILRCGLKNLIYTSGVYERFPQTKLNEAVNSEHIAEYVLTHEIEETPPILPKITNCTVEINSRNLCPEEIMRLREALKNCVKHHLAIVKVCALVEDFLNIFAFLRVAEMTLQICFLAFVYAKTSEFIPLLFMLLTFVDLFLITYPAEHIQAESNSVGKSLMLGPWYLISKHFHKEFIIIMAYSMRPIRFTAGKIMKLNAERFRAVITTAFSYYTLLSSFDRSK